VLPTRTAGEVGRSGGTVWELGLGHEVLCTFREIGYETPWTYGELHDPAKLHRFREYFGPDDACPETPEFDALLAEISDKGGF
jgi:hypothetical protein